MKVILNAACSMDPSPSLKSSPIRIPSTSVQPQSFDGELDVYLLYIIVPLMLLRFQISISAPVVSYIFRSCAVSPQLRLVNGPYHVKRLVETWCHQNCLYPTFIMLITTFDTIVTEKYFFHVAY